MLTGEEIIHLNQRLDLSATRQKILAIIVLYNTPFEESVSYLSLQRAALKAAPALHLCILLYDNTPGATIPEDLPPYVKYCCGTSNRGLAGAYNFALGSALEQGFEWLLTLDQDTALPEDSLVKYAAKAKALQDETAVAVIAPQIVADGRVVSPNYFLYGAWPRWFAPGFCGIPEQPVYAFNSGSLIRISALRQARGYSPWFWLDNSDSAIYRKLGNLGKKVYVAGDLRLDHDFSLLNLRDRVTPERYGNILISESAFWDLEMNAIAGLERTVRLAGRLIKQSLRRDPAQLRRLTWRALCARLFKSRKARIASWRAATRARLGDRVDEWGDGGRPKVSVCMAAYNGGRFIETQLRSIVPQLCARDEIVIVDDGSDDDTVCQIRHFQAELALVASAPRISLSVHEANRGVVPTFEEAIRRATGDVIFLCDDDDVWASDKVEKMLNAFCKNPEVQLVCTELQLIDVDGNPMLDTGILQYRCFSPNVMDNLWHNQFQGSTMAFRSTLIEHILPLPAGKLFVHDVWIGICNTLAGGRSLCLEERLLLYRRHSANYSRRLSRANQIRLRLQLVAALVKKGLAGAFN